MDRVEALAEELWRRTRYGMGYRKSGNLTLLGKLPQDEVRRENFTAAVRQALEDDVIRFGGEKPQGQLD